MQDKDMVNDVLWTLNGSLTGYANIIAQSSNPDFRSTLQQLRNGDETFQYDLFKVAWEKGYYKPAGQADQSDISAIKSQFSS